MAASLQLAAQITEKIDQGELAPGMQLSEIRLAEELGVSRNTLREAFRVLARDGLVDHIPNRGVFVHTFTIDDVNDLYGYRLFVETAAIRMATMNQSNLAQSLKRMEAAYKAGAEAAAAGDWRRVGTANSAFHLALVDIAGVQRLSTDARKVLALARIGFLSTSVQDTTHGPYVEKNHALLELLKAGEFDQAEQFVREYLEHSRANLLALLPAR